MRRPQVGGATGRRLLKALLALALVASLGAVPATAQDKPSQKEEAAPARAPNVSVTRHSGTFGGQRVNYVATAGETFLKDKEGNHLFTEDYEEFLRQKEKSQREGVF